MRLSRRSCALVGIITFIFISIFIFFFDNLSGGSSHDHHHHHHNYRHFLPGLNQQVIRDLEEDVRLVLPAERSGHVNGSSADDTASGSASTALLRILVLTYNRASSLTRCLSAIDAAEYDGQRVVVEIHIDRSKDGKVHNDTVNAAKAFAFKHGPVQVLVRPRHGGIIGQWLSSWKVPMDNESEIALFVEDDITLSPFFARWLRRVHGKYDGYPTISGYALQGESIRHAVGASSSNLEGPPGQCVFLYPVLGTWGFSPNTRLWREFVRWYHEASLKPDFIPHVPGLQPSEWYRGLHLAGRAETMWSMWHIHYTYQKQQYVLYPNLPEKRGLAFNWKEPGEHYSKSLMGKGVRPHLLETWREEDLRLPERLVIMDAKGVVTGKTMSPAGIE